MADERHNPEPDDELLLTDEVQPGAAAHDGEDDGEDEETLTFDGDAEEKDGDTNLVRHLRQQIRDRDKRLAEAARSAPQPQKIEVGPKPTIAGCDYDEEKYEAELDAWKEREAAAKQQDKQASQAGEQEAQAWQAELQRYSEGKSKLGFKDIDDAEETVKASLDTAQQAVLVMAADDPARLTYALGRHPAKLAELASEKNPLKLAAKIARLEGQLKVVKGRAAPALDTPERGSGKISHQNADKRLKKLEEEAAKTGDRTALISYRKQLQAAKK